MSRYFFTTLAFIAYMVFALFAFTTYEMGHDAAMLAKYSGTEFYWTGVVSATSMAIGLFFLNLGFRGIGKIILAGTELKCC